MTTEEKKTPWKNGYWYNKSQACFLMIIEGEKVELKNLVCLEYPGISYFYIEKWTFKVMYEVYYRAKRDKKEAS